MAKDVAVDIRLTSPRTIIRGVNSLPQNPDQLKEAHPGFPGGLAVFRYLGLSKPLVTKFLA